MPKQKDEYKVIDKIILEQQEKRLAKQQKKIKNWEKEFDEKFETDEFVDENFYTRSDNMLSYGRDDIKSFIRQEKQNSYFEGFIDGSDATAIQASEINIVEINEYKEKILKDLDKLKEKYLK